MSAESLGNFTEGDGAAGIGLNHAALTGGVATVVFVTFTLRLIGSMGGTIAIVLVAPPGFEPGTSSL